MPNTEARTELDLFAFAQVQQERASYCAKLIAWLNVACESQKYKDTYFNDWLRMVDHHLEGIDRQNPDLKIAFEMMQKLLISLHRFTQERQTDLNFTTASRKVREIVNAGQLLLGVSDPNAIALLETLTISKRPEDQDLGADDFYLGLAIHPSFSGIDPKSRRERIFLEGSIWEAFFIASTNQECTPFWTRPKSYEVDVLTLYQFRYLPIPQLPGK